VTRGKRNKTGAKAENEISLPRGAKLRGATRGAGNQAMNTTESFIEANGNILIDGDDNGRFFRRYSASFLSEHQMEQISTYSQPKRRSCSRSPLKSVMVLPVC
jgi:hypothetical protein